MKITFYSNFLNHHQLPFCLELYKKIGKDFVFCANQTTPQDRISCGWENMNDSYPFVLKKYENINNEKKAFELAYTSDVVILGDSSSIYKDIRIKSNKFFFRATERPFKIKRNLLKAFKDSLMYWNAYRKERNSLLLCCGRYVYRDFLSFLCYRKRALKFGYFPQLNDIDIVNVNKRPNSFIWVGRFIDWKHPEYVIKFAEELVSKKIDFNITMIGDGPLFNAIKKEIFNKKLNDYITLTGAVHYSKINKYMLPCEYHLFTSDRQEGWGAVLNESMSCGCIPIANAECGSTKYLIKNKVNGFIYKKSFNSFLKLALKTITLDEKQKKQMKINAFKTIYNEWNYKNAVEELLRISFEQINNKNIKFKKTGVCSRAKM